MFILGEELLSIPLSFQRHQQQQQQQRRQQQQQHNNQMIKN